MVSWSRGKKKNRRGKTELKRTTKTPVSDNSADLHIDESFDLDVTLYSEHSRTRKTGPYGRKELRLVIASMEDAETMHAIIGALTLPLNEFVGLMSHELKLPIECDQEIVDSIGAPYLYCTIRSWYKNSSGGGSSIGSGVTSTGWTHTDKSDSDGEIENLMISHPDVDPIKYVDNNSTNSPLKFSIDSVPESAENEGINSDQEDDNVKSAVIVQDKKLQDSEIKEGIVETEQMQIAVVDEEETVKVEDNAKTDNAIVGKLNTKVEQEKQEEEEANDAQLQGVKVNTIADALASDIFHINSPVVGLVAGNYSLDENSEKAASNEIPLIPENVYEEGPINDEITEIKQKTVGDSEEEDSEEVPEFMMLPSLAESSTSFNTSEPPRVPFRSHIKRLSTIKSEGDQEEEEENDEDDEETEQVIQTEEKLITVLLTTHDSNLSSVNDNNNDENNNPSSSSTSFVSVIMENKEMPSPKLETTENDKIETKDANPTETENTNLYEIKISDPIKSIETHHPDKSTKIDLNETKEVDLDEVKEVDVIEVQDADLVELKDGDLKETKEVDVTAASIVSSKLVAEEEVKIKSPVKSEIEAVEEEPPIVEQNPPVLVPRWLRWFFCIPGSRLVCCQPVLPREP
eukprot:g3554.t1